MAERIWLRARRGGKTMAAAVSIQNRMSNNSTTLMPPEPEIQWLDWNEPVGPIQVPESDTLSNGTMSAMMRQVQAEVMRHMAVNTATLFNPITSTIPATVDPVGPGPVGPVGIPGVAGPSVGSTISVDHGGSISVGSDLRMNVDGVTYISEAPHSLFLGGGSVSTAPPSTPFTSSEWQREYRGNVMGIVESDIERNRRLIREHFARFGDAAVPGTWGGVSIPRATPASPVRPASKPAVKPKPPVATRPTGRRRRALPAPAAVEADFEEMALQY